MPVATRVAFFDHAAVAPLSEPARLAVRRWADEATENGNADWPRWDRRQSELRELAARLVNADKDEIALVQNTTAGINLVAEGLDWRERDNIVTLADEFPSNQYAWLNQQSRGVEVRRVPTDNGRVDLDRLESACDQRTRLISISWVGYLSGWRNDLNAIADIARRQGAMFFLDAIQGLGVFPLDVQKTRVDFFAADGHKWLLGPEGAGLFYIRREHLDRLRPIGVGWNSVPHASDFTRIEWEPRASAARYEGGTANAVGLLGLAESLELLMSFGTEAIRERILSYTTTLCEQLRNAGTVIHSHREQAEHCSGIVTFELPGVDSQHARRVCARANVALSCRAGRLRVSPHAYNDQTDLDRLLAALEEAG
ncbi:MAG: aminotransferase class V-fold PLP-dependent enzyme [Planctomycetota bacterium]|nr:aminotransferase class V-fold PLP-dependent enzyme [Planctomycetota bacterium]